MSPTPTYQPPEPQRSGLLTALVAGALIALVAANIYLYVQIDHLRTDVATVQEKLTTSSAICATRRVSTPKSQKRHIETLKEELEARARAGAAAPRARRRPKRWRTPTRWPSSCRRSRPRCSSRSAPRSAA